MIIFSAPWWRGSGPANDLCHGIVSVKPPDLAVEPNCNPSFLKSGGIVAMHPAMIPSASSTIALIDTALYCDVLVSADSYLCIDDIQCPIYCVLACSCRVIQRSIDQADDESNASANKNQ